MEFDVDALTEGLEIQNTEDIKGRNGIIVFLAAAGTKPFAIARQLDMSEEGVKYILAKPVVVEEISRMTNEIGRKLVGQRLLGLSNEALSTVAGLMRMGENDTIRLRASQDILDRAKFSRNDKPEEDRAATVNDLIKYLESQERKEQMRLNAGAVDADFTDGRSESPSESRPVQTVS